MLFRHPKTPSDGTIKPISNDDSEGKENISANGVVEVGDHFQANMLRSRHPMHVFHLRVSFPATKVEGK